MSYPPPPGLNSSSSSNKPSSLPARPPPSTVPPAPVRPPFQAQPYSGPGNSNASYTPYGGFAPRQVSTPTISHAPYAAPAYQQQPQYNSYDAGPSNEAAFGAAPQIRNPFPLPGQAGSSSRYEAPVDPEMEAQIAQWQSAYSKDTSDPRTKFRFNAGGEGLGSATSANAAPLGGTGGRNDISASAVSSAVHADTGVATVVSGADGKTATVVRSGGGTQWTDSSLLEWDPSHFRIFVGNLAGEVTDDSLLKAFSRWPSVQKARVVRDKRTTKSKGFGFVSFSDGDEFFQAAREMQGKYIGSHPVLIKRSTTEIKAVVPKDHRKGGRHGKNNKGKGGNGGGNGGGGGGGANTGAGVHKPGSKTKGGLKVLG